MSLIKIIANNIELDVVKETLTITKENTSMSSDFKVACSDFPFLIVENSKTEKVLGGRDITTANKTKTVPVIVEELNEKYYGELRILSYLPGFRKVTLKYATELLQIMDTNISSFMPVTSVIPGEVNPVLFSEESASVILGHEHWPDFVSPYINESYPNVKFNFPMMSWKNKFGADLEPDDDWINYKQHINYFDEDDNFVLNNYSIVDSFTTDNQNVPAPQIYLLSPLFYALKSLGWTMEGNFTTSEFVKKIMFLSAKNNLCKTEVSLETIFINYPALPIWNVFLYRSRPTCKTIVYQTLPDLGKVTFNWMFKINDPTTDVKTFAEFRRTREIRLLEDVRVEIEKVILFQNAIVGFDKVYSGSHEFEVIAGDEISITYYNLHQIMPMDYSLTIQKKDNSKVFHQFHPTIQLGRYLPEWTFGTYLNELKKLFNLKIDTDDFIKKISLNFNENIIQNSEKEVLRKSLAIKTHDQPLFNAFHLGYQNDIDKALWITREGIEAFIDQKSDFSNKLDSKFKFVPNNGYTAELSDDLANKDGVGLMIYNHDFAPYISSHYENKTLKIDGQNGIYTNFWKKWLKFRLNAVPIEITGYFTETELFKIQKKQRTYVDRQDYIVSSLEYSEADQSNFDVLLKLESVSF